MSTTTVFTEYPVDEFDTGLDAAPIITKYGTVIDEAALSAVQAAAESSRIGLGVGTPPFFTNYAAPPLDVAAETERAEGVEATLAAAIAAAVSTVSPAFSGTPTAPTATLGTDTTQLATTAFVQAAIAASGSAGLASPAFTGTPTAPTASPLTDSSQIATTGYADAAVAVALAAAETFATNAVSTETARAEGVENALAPKASPTLTGTPLAPTAATSTNTTQIATTAFVQAALPTTLPPNGAAGGDLSDTFPNPGVAKLAGVAAASYALLASPTFIGTPLAPTAATSTNTQQIATTQFVQTAANAVAATAAAEVAASIFPSAGKYPALHKVFARVMCGAQDQKVLLVGDSTYQGVWADFGQGPVPYIVNALNAAGINAAFGLAAAPGTGFSDPRWTAGSGWTQGTGITNAGWAGLDTLWQGSNTSGTLSFQPDVGVFDTFDIYYLTSTGAYGFHVNFNGGTDTVVNANTGSFTVAKVTVSGSPTATPICNIHAASGFGATIVGVEARLSTAQTLRVGNAGISGATTAGWVSTPGTAGYGSLDCIKAYAPDLTIIGGPGINDLNAGTSTSTILSELATLIAACEVSGTVVLATENPFITTTVSQATQDAYWAAYKAFAATNGYPLIDVYGAWGGAAAFSALNTLGYYGDALVHPSAGEGQPDAGRVIAAGLLAL